MLTYLSDSFSIDKYTHWYHMCTAQSEAGDSSDSDSDSDSDDKSEKCANACMFHANNGSESEESEKCVNPIITLADDTDDGVDKYDTGAIIPMRPHSYRRLTHMDKRSWPWARLEKSVKNP